MYSISNWAVWRIGAIGLFSLVAMGCADSVLFVTKTSIGLDFDTKPPAASIAYDRTEGYLAPRYDNGAIPPVYGRIRSDAKIFNANVRQIYATGSAAQRVLWIFPAYSGSFCDPILLNALSMAAFLAFSSA